MASQLTNKQLVVLDVLRRHGPISCKEVAELVTQETLCSVCDGTGAGDDPRWGCTKCYGRGHPLFAYSDAYQALQQLRHRRLVTRRCKRDEWGDELPMHLYKAAPEHVATDKLEQLWQQPVYEEPA